MRSLRQSHVVILGYHRVSELNDPFDLAVSPGEFEAHLRFLARSARPVTLQQAAMELGRGSIAPRTVVVTFDDGYDDTLAMAAPLLRTYGVPATVFITTGNPGEPFWWHVLAHCVFGETRLPDRLSVEAGGRRYSYATSNRARGLRQLAAILRPLPATERAAVLSSLAEQCGLRTLPALPRALRKEEITLLASEPLVEIGAHTVTHPPLARVPVAQRRTEIVNSQRTLETLTGVLPRSFSYPHGSVDRVTRDLITEAGFSVACTTDPDVATPASDPIALPRLWVDGRRKAGFARWLNRWLG